MLNKEARNEVETLATNAQLNPAALMAVVDVESGGKVFASVNGKQEPLIRFEGHYFYRLLGAAKRNRAVANGLADRRFGKIKNPRSQKGRWKLLKRAKAIDNQAALQSTSWGVGQVMGSHWRWLEYASVDAMVSQARLGLTGQVELMLRFIEKAGLSDALREHNWRAFARGYNGASYARNRYDKKLAAAFERYQGATMEHAISKPKHRNQPLYLQFGDQGALVKELQIQLRKCGFHLIADGDFGPVTLQRVRRFQNEHDLVVDGIVGPKTFLMLNRIAGK